LARAFFETVLARTT